MSARMIRGSWTVDFYFGGERCRKRGPLNTEEGALAYEMFLRKEAALWGSVGAALRANAPADRAPCPTLREFMPRWFAGYVAVNNRPKERDIKRLIAERYLLPELGAPPLRYRPGGDRAVQGEAARGGFAPERLPASKLCGVIPKCRRPP